MTWLPHRVPLFIACRGGCGFEALRCRHFAPLGGSIQARLRLPCLCAEPPEQARLPSRLRFGDAEGLVPAIGAALAVSARVFRQKDMPWSKPTDIYVSLRGAPDNFFDNMFDAFLTESYRRCIMKDADFPLHGAFRMWY